jgi:hypothetical protein
LAQIEVNGNEVSRQNFDFTTERKGDLAFVSSDCFCQDEALVAKQPNVPPPRHITAQGRVRELVVGSIRASGEPKRILRGSI